MLVLGLWVAGSVCAGIGWCAHALLTAADITELERELDEVYAELADRRSRTRSASSN
jgi:hypothetical protein